MKYFAMYDDGGKLVSFGATTAKAVMGEITEDEYNALMVAHVAKTDYADRVYSGEIAIDDVPEEYRAEVAELVEQMRVEPETPMTDIDEALAILRGEVTE